MWVGVPYFFFKKMKDLLLAWNLPSRVVWLNEGLQGTLVSASLILLGLQAGASIPRPCILVPGTELRPSCSYNRHLTKIWAQQMVK